jgi:hypothetical protein
MASPSGYYPIIDIMQSMLKGGEYPKDEEHDTTLIGRD